MKALSRVLIAVCLVISASGQHAVFADAAHDDYVRAQRFIQNGQMADAVKVLTRAIQAEPKFLNAYIARGFALSRMGKLEQALNEYEKVLGLSANNAVALCNKGFCLYKMGKLDDALVCMNRAHELDPERPDFLANRAEVLLKLGQTDRALEDANTSIAFDDTDADPYITRADALMQKKRVKEALKDYSKAISLNPDPVHMFHPEGESYYKRAQIYNELGNREAAARDMQTSRTLGYTPELIGTKSDTSN